MGSIYQQIIRSSPFCWKNTLFIFLSGAQVEIELYQDG